MSGKIERFTIEKTRFYKENRPDSIAIGSFNNMIISVITVSLNSENTIKRTIDSVVSQLVDGVEYIIIDGGSTDNTVNIIKNYSAHLSKWVSEEDNGIYDAMNKGIKIAKGDYVCFLNSDDYFEDNEVVNMINSINDSKDADVVYGNIRYLFPDGKIKYSKLNLDVIDFLDKGMYLPHPSLLAKKKLFGEIGLFDAQYKIAADYDWILHLYLEKGKDAFFHSDSFATIFSMDGISNKHYVQALIESRNISLKYAKLYKYSNEKTKEIEKYTYEIILLSYLYRSNDLKKELRKKLNLDMGKVWIFGSGKAYWSCKAFLEELEIKVGGILDNDRMKWNTVIDGIKILKPSPDTIVNNTVIISSKNYWKEIKKQLLKMGISEDKIFTTSHLRELALKMTDDSIRDNKKFLDELTLKL